MSGFMQTLFKGGPSSRYGLEISIVAKELKLNQRVLKDNFNIWRGYSGKTGMGPCFAPLAPQPE